MNTLKIKKPCFYEVCVMYAFNSERLQNLADISGISKSIVDMMCIGTAVERADALKVLAALSQLTHREWTLGNVNVALAHAPLTTFADLHVVYQFDTASLSLQAGVPIAVIDQMLCDHPVPKGDAMKALQMLSSQTGQSYTLNNVAVKLIDEERQHG